MANGQGSHLTLRQKTPTEKRLLTTPGNDMKRSDNFLV